MEKGPEFRIVGNVPERIKEETKEVLRGRLFERHLEDISDEDKKKLESLEYPKSDMEKTLIAFANEETGKLMEEAGVNSYDVPERNLHMAPPEEYKKICGDKSSATTVQREQVIIFDADSLRDNPINFGRVAFHELLHLKSHFTMEVEPRIKGDGFTRTSYREGVGVHATQKKGFGGEYHEHFRGLHEAIVSSQEKAYVSRMLELPEFAGERSWLNSEEARKMKKQIAEKKNIPEDEIYWVNKDGTDYITSSYRFQRKVFELIAHGIQEENPDKYASAEDVKKEFLNANFTGRLLPIARLVKSAFGEGSFRILGAMGSDKETSLQTYEILRKARSRMKK